jgi:hypothetical protein
MTLNRWASLFTALFTALAPAFGAGEEVLKFGAGSGWDKFTGREGLTELEGVRRHKVIALGSGPEKQDAALDMALSFDEGRPELFIDSAGHYSLHVSRSVNSAEPAWARFGSGAAIFSSAPAAGAETGGAAVVMSARRHDALFSAGRGIGDFSIEFWLYPLGMENGEEPFLWTAAIRGNTASSRTQTLSCSVSRNRTEWNFTNIFFKPASFNGTDGQSARAGNAVSIDTRLVSSSPVIPKRWSHHLLRFSAETGLLEYLVNGVLEDVVYATASGGEGGEVFLPVAGESGSFTLGKRFNGMMDDFRIYSRFVEESALHSYSESGRLQSAPVDLGGTGSSILYIKAAGGVYNSLNRKTLSRTEAAGPFNFSGGEQILFFLRSSASLYEWDEAAWRVFTPGEPLNMAVGRYIEIAARFYPGAGFETTPYLEELSVVYAKKPAPRPPERLIARPKNGAVELSWPPSKDESAAGYLVYYGTASGNYFGEGGAPGDSPIDAGKQSSICIDNLKNGVLYFFSVSVYDKNGMSGDYSKEVSARPLRVNNE